MLSAFPFLSSILWSLDISICCFVSTYALNAWLVIFHAHEALYVLGSPLRPLRSQLAYLSPTLMPLWATFSQRPSLFFPWIPALKFLSHLLGLGWVLVLVSLVPSLFLPCTSSLSSILVVLPVPIFCGHRALPSFARLY
ncbi:hypothetical protein C8R45DRAFT_1000478 [Mycena sanguinolenta]|nr:hypothetical protein C8R45DRAFT_1000478 [Mycena sanguinolenta]